MLLATTAGISYLYQTRTSHAAALLLHYGPACPVLQ